jgi:deoxyribodipyrimidine photolyase-related protein
MWTTLPFGWHALVGSSLNLHLLHPREVIVAAEQAYHARGLPLASVEGFIRQVLGWLFDDNYLDRLTTTMLAG